MAQVPKLSNREWEVVMLLLQGKSNKLIALSLDISDRTVEFHLRNVYAKFQVGTRIELILKLGNATGMFDSAILGHSTVDGSGENSENRGRSNSRKDWAPSLGDATSMIGKEFGMKSLLSSKHVLVGTITALLTGFAWTSMLIFTHSLSLNDFRAWIVPLIVIGVIVGSSVGLFGKRRGNTLPQVLSSTLFGMGLSPITIIPLMTMVVLPVGKLAEWIGLIEPSTMPRDVATVLAMIAMTMIWLVVASAIGIVCLSVINKKPKQTVVQPYAAE